MTITVSSIKENVKGWVLTVVLEDGEQSSYTVSIDQAYWRELTNATVTPEDLVKASFEFLLEREPASAILSSFDLRIVARYFSEYEIEMQKRFHL